MTSEQVTELGQALEILSAKSSVLKERIELRALMEEHKSAEAEVRPFPLTTSLPSPSWFLFLSRVPPTDMELSGRKT